MVLRRLDTQILGKVVGHLFDRQSNRHDSLQNGTVMNPFWRSKSALSNGTCSFPFIPDTKIFAVVLLTHRQILDLCRETQQRQCRIDEATELVAVPDMGMLAAGQVEGQRRLAPIGDEHAGRQGTQLLPKARLAGRAVGGEQRRVTLFEQGNEIGAGIGEDFRIFALRQIGEVLRRR